MQARSCRRIRTGLDVLHEREYRIRAYRLPPEGDGGDRLLLRGAVRDQKPAHLYIAADPDRFAELGIEPGVFGA